MRNYSRKFRRNYRGGVWPFDNPQQELEKAKANVVDANKKLEEAQAKVNASPQTPENSDPGLVQQAEAKATDAFNAVTSMIPSFPGSNKSNESPPPAQNGGRRRSRRRRSSRRR